MYEDNEENEIVSIMVPILTHELTTLTFVVPTEFADRVQMDALKIVDSFERHPSNIEMDKNNKMMQAMSFVIQNAFQGYLVDEFPPEIDE